MPAPASLAVLGADPKGLAIAAKQAALAAIGWRAAVNREQRHGRLGSPGPAGPDGQRE